MNTPDPFEERLLAAPFRSPPPGWERRILQAANPPPRPSPAARLARLWGGWPHPALPWSLAAAWSLVLLLRVASPMPSTPTHGATSHPVDPRPAAEQRRALLSSLADTPEPSQVPHDRTASPRSDAAEPHLGLHRKTPPRRFNT